MKDALFSIRNLYRRLSSESPSFFRKLRNLCVMLAAAGGAIEAYMQLHPTVLFPAIIVKATGYLVACGLVGALISAFTVADNSNVRP